MSATPERGGLSAEDLARILEVTRGLAAPFDLMAMLAAVTTAARQVLRADRSSVWLHDPTTDELVLEVATDIRHVRVPVGAGLVGSCARDRQIINVPDCYADPRFDPGVDKRTGYRTRCILTLPLIDHRGVLVGVMQVLNRADGVFDEADERLAAALAAQCAVALQRVRMTEALIEGEKMRQELEVARLVQMSTLPAAMPAIDGYDAYGTSRPATLTGGDTFDLATIEPGLLIVLGDATGHGIGPALSVTQMHAMLRMAFRLGAGLESVFVEVNNLLAETLAADRFITAFIGLLDPAAHVVRYLSGGQGPILHFHAETGACTRHRPTSFPLGAMPLAATRPAVTLAMRPGDVLLLLSDGVYEYQDATGRQFGEERVERVVAEHHGKPMAALAGAVLDSLGSFARGAPQEDDVTIVLLKRYGAATSGRMFPRSVASLNDIFAFTAEVFAREKWASPLLPSIDLAVEELFTNIVKYGGGHGAVLVELAAMADGVVLALTDFDADRFDVTQAAPVDVSRPIDERVPGGLGLHLIRHFADSIEYYYSEAERRGRTTFRKTWRAAAAANSGEKDAHD